MSSSSLGRATIAPSAHFPINRHAREAEKGSKVKKLRELREERKKKKKEEEAKSRHYRITTMIIVRLLGCAPDRTSSIK